NGVPLRYPGISAGSTDRVIGGDAGAPPRGSRSPARRGRPSRPPSPAARGVATLPKTLGRSSPPRGQRYARAPAALVPPRTPLPGWDPAEAPRPERRSAGVGTRVRAGEGDDRVLLESKGSAGERHLDRGRPLVVPGEPVSDTKRDRIGGAGSRDSVDRMPRTA